MRDAFGVERPDMISKKIKWSGEPGDKRNTKYAAAVAGGSFVPVLGNIGTGLAYGLYRQTDKSKANRAASIAFRKKEKKS